VSERPTLKKELELLIKVAGEAAEIALDFFRDGARSWTKDGNSPVTEADIAVDRLFHRRLLEARPGYGFLSEESKDDGSRLTAPRTFIVDPIDGTRAFIAGATDWTIPVALVEDGRPHVCVVAAPARHELYRAIAGEGAFRNDEPIHVSGREHLDGASLAVSQRLLRSISGTAPIKARSVFYASLAYRLARVADGRLDGAAIKPNSQDWDLAAVDLLLHEAGGILANLDGSPPRYDRPVTAHGALVAGPPALCSELTKVAKSALPSANADRS
jgi:myo-inositol-1(or 4)-monophosphatase